MDPLAAPSPDLLFADLRPTAGPLPPGHAWDRPEILSDPAVPDIVASAPCAECAEQQALNRAVFITAVMVGAAMGVAGAYLIIKMVGKK